MRSRWPIALLTLALCGCTTLGADFDVAAAERLRPGTSMYQVIRQLGPPSGQGSTEDGNEILVWLYNRKTPFGERGKSVSLLFDRYGALLETGHVSRTGISGTGER
jgi:hypothetical protein